MRFLFPFIVLLFSTLLVKSQDKSVFQELDKKLWQRPLYIKIPGKGIVSGVRSKEKSGKNSTVNFRFDMYDMELNKIWSWTDFEKVPFKWYDTQISQSYSDAINGKFDIDGNYSNILLYDGVGNKVYKIDIKSGKSQSLNLSKTTDFEYYNVEAYADDKTYYIVYINKDNKQKGEDPTSIELFKIDIETMKESYSKIQIPAVGEQNFNSGTRNWVILGAYDDRLYFKDSYHIYNKEGSFRQLMSYNLNDGNAKKIHILIGESNTVYLGDVKFNQLKDGLLYSFCTISEDGKRKSIFTCLNDNLDLVWQKKFVAGGGNGGATKIVGDLMVERIDKNVVVSSSLGLDRFSLEYFPSNGEFKYVDSEIYKKECDIPFKYDIACSTYLNFKKYPKVKSFVDRDMKKNKDNVDILTLYTDNGIILINQPQISSKFYIKMDLFKF